MMVLEQFMDDLEMARWVRCHQSASLEATVTLAEDHLAAWTKAAEIHSQPGDQAHASTEIEAPWPLLRGAATGALGHKPFFTWSACPGPGRSRQCIQATVGGTGVLEVQAAGI